MDPCRGGLYLLLPPGYEGHVPKGYFVFRSSTYNVFLFFRTVKQLPDTADMEEIMYRLYVLDKVRKGQGDIEQGRLTPAEDLKHEIEQW